MPSELLPELLLKEKDREVLNRIHLLVRSWPDQDLYPKLLLSLLRFPDEFKRIRAVPHLSRLVCAEYFYKRKLVQESARAPQKRHFFVKFLRAKLQYPFGSKDVLGVVVVLNLLKQREVFDEQHMVEAIKRLVPEAEPIKGSFLDDSDKQANIQSVYLEVEREEKPFTLEEIATLRERLPNELKECVEQLVPMTFMRRNEEEVYRYILALRDQLKTVRDIPQAAITFEEQTQFDLFFTVVVLRLVQEGERSVRALFEEKNPDMLYIPDRIDVVGTLRRKYQKEATVFRLQIPKNPFFRKDRSVNLYTARRHVVSRLSRALGPVRDFNGGLILKQSERLDDFLALMPHNRNAFLLENFFYSISPIAMQSILPATLVKEWFLAFSASMDQELSTSKVYTLSLRKTEEALLVIVQAEEESFKEDLLSKVGQFEIPSLELAFSEIKVDGAFCLGLLYRPSQFGREKELLDAIRSVMERWSQNQRRVQALHLSLHESDPSLDPRITKGEHSSLVVSLLFEGLTRLGRDGKAQLAVAESYDRTRNFKHYTFHLRKTIWSNGAPVTAHDFEYAWKKALSQRSHHAHALFVLKNARRAFAGEVPFDEVGVKALDDQTLAVALESAAPYFLEAVAHWCFLPISHQIDHKYPGWAYQASENFVCNGPFSLAAWKHNQEIMLRKNVHYWDLEGVHLDRIAITLVGREQNEWQMLESGELDIIGRPMGVLPTGGVVQKKEIEQVSFPLEANLSLCLNTAQLPFNHQKLRQAFAYALDRDVLRTQSAPDCAAPSFSLIPEALSFADTSLFPDRDLEKARTLFQEGLGEIGFVRSDFPKLVFIHCSNRHREDVVCALAQQWEEVFGVEFLIKALDPHSYLNALSRGEFQLAVVECHAFWSDAYHMLDRLRKREEVMNYSSWEHPVYQRLLEEAAQGTVKERALCLAHAEAILADEMPLIPLYRIEGSYWKRGELQGEIPSSFFQIEFKSAYRRG